jgi:hypothetical protein
MYVPGLFIRSSFKKTVSRGTTQVLPNVGFIVLRRWTLTATKVVCKDNAKSGRRG